MPKLNPRNKVGVIVHAVLKIVLGDHTAKNIYENVNYAKTFIQGIIVNIFDGCMPGGKNAIWKLTVNFEMPSDETALRVDGDNLLGGREMLCTINIGTESRLCPPALTMGAWAADAGPSQPTCLLSSPAMWGTSLSPPLPLIMPSIFCMVTIQMRGVWGGQKDCKGGRSQ